MTVFLDTEQIATDTLGPNARVGQLLDMVKDRVNGSGRLILGMKCNEEDVDSEEIASMVSTPIAEFDRLDFISGDPRDMVLDALDGVRRAFEQTFQVVREAGDDLARGDAQRAMNRLADCFSVWGQTVDAVQSSGRLLGIDLDAFTIEDRTITAWVSDLATKLREVRSAIEARDSVLLADIVRYELDETMQAWDRMLAGFIVHIENT